MTYEYETCRLCGVTLKAHGCNLPYLMRGHIERLHPEAFKEIKALEEKFRELKREKSELLQKLVKSWLTIFD